MSGKSPKDIVQYPQSFFFSPAQTFSVHVFRPLRTFIAIRSMKTFFLNQAETFFSTFIPLPNFFLSVCQSVDVSVCVSNFVSIHTKQSVCTPKLSTDSYQVSHASLFGL